jgi:hypothetical protein
MKTRTTVWLVAVSMVVWICAVGLLLPLLSPGF